MSNRAAIYARYSSESQRDASIEDQVRSCRARASRENFEVVLTKADHAISGATSVRPGLQAVLAAARDRKIDVVLTEGLDRLSRDQEHIAGFFKQLSFNGVRIISLSEGEISELHVGLKGTMNALFLKDLAIKTHRGLEGRVRAGKSGGGLSYGYRVVRKLNDAGQAVTGEREVDEIQAAIVRRVFEQYLNGLSPRAIAVTLNREGVAGPRGGNWTASLILGNATRETGILRNRLYAGVMVWNRQHFTKDPSTGKRVARVNQQAAWIVEAVPSLEIVPTEVWHATQERLSERRVAVLPACVGPPECEQDTSSAAGRLAGMRRPVWLLSGLVRCGVCNGPMTVVGANGRLGCANHRERGTCSNQRSILRAKLTSQVLVGLKNRLLTPVLVEAFARSYVEQSNAAQAVHAQNQATARIEIARIDRQIANLLAVMRDGGSCRSMVDDLRSLETRREALETVISASCAPEPTLTVHPNLALVYRRKVEQLEEALREPEAEAAASTALRSLIDAILIYPGVARGEVSVLLRGHLAAFLHLPDEGTGDRSANTRRADLHVVVGSSGVVMRTLVAGTGFEPVTFRL